MNLRSNYELSLSKLEACVVSGLLWTELGLKLYWYPINPLIDDDISEKKRFHLDPANSTNIDSNRVKSSKFHNFNLILRR